METSVPLPRWQLPRLDPNSRWLGGVASAIAREIGVQPTVIRVAFALSLVVGWGLVLYALIWAVLVFFAPSQLSPYHPQLKGATPFLRHLAVALITIGFMFLFGQLFPSEATAITWPVGFVLAGSLIAWSRGASDEGISFVVRIVAGLAVAIGGVIAFAVLVQVSLTIFIVSLAFGLAIVAGVTIVAAPSVVHLARTLDSERMERIRNDERARISAHLHDSVLQTLSLIQRNADDPAQTAHLARRQERELRGWLYGQSTNAPDGIRLGPALEQAADEVENAHDVQIDVVAVGDTGAGVQADVGRLIAATKEAMTNAAIHSGVNRIDVFAERRVDAIEIFVRDTGNGFNVGSIPGDRRGVAESIIGRMERAGGSAQIVSAPGEGTEVELLLPLETSAENTDQETAP